MEIVVGEKAKRCPPASISVVGVLQEHEHGPLMTAIVPLGNDAVPETLDVIVTSVNEPQIAKKKSTAKAIAARLKSERVLF